MSEEKKELNDELLIKVAGGAGDITPKYQVGDIFGLKLSKYSYVYGMVTDILYSVDGPYSYLYNVKRKANITGTYGTINNYDLDYESYIGPFDETAKKFDELPALGFFDRDYEYFY